MRALIVFKNTKADNPQACHIGLGCSASNTADVLTEHGMPTEAVPVFDGYDIRNRLRKGLWPGLTHVVFSAPFFHVGFMEEIVREFPHIQFATTFHSNCGFLGVDNWSTRILLEEIELERRAYNFHVAGNSEKFCKAVQLAFLAPCTLLPNLYFLHGQVDRPRKHWDGGKLRIGAFGATRILKNLPVAAWAALIIANALQVDTEFHISAGREEGTDTVSVLGNIRKMLSNQKHIKLVEQKWLPWFEFRRAMRHMHLLMQPSFTESFNGVTADGVAEGVPSVVGPAIDWVPATWIANPDDAVEVATVGQNLLHDKNAPAAGYCALVRHNQMALRAWRTYFASYR
jgi:hypothetical protein